MPELIDEKPREELKRVLAILPSQIKLLYFTQVAVVGGGDSAFTAGEDAKATLGAYDYLIANKLVARKAVLDFWQQ
jgi:hypothetical protein